MPLVGGHEGAGIVVARGEHVEDVQVGFHQEHLLFHEN
jgi:Zn-dependent alcohol dehydrogenase